MTITLTQINIYPVKSLAGAAVSEARVEERGLRFDHRWMVVEPDGTFLTQRELPAMACIQTRVNAHELRLSAADSAPLTIPLPVSRATLLPVRVWQSHCDALLVSEEADAWLSRVLHHPCRLVYMPDESRRPVNPEFALRDEIVSFADGYPLLVIGERSLEDLNGRLETPVPMNRFRPNLVAAGTEAYAEDTWKTVRVGAVLFRGVKRCDRCAMPTIDQETGKRTGNEPIKTLTQYRLFGNKVYFGQFLIPESQGMIRLGDPVEVLETMA